MIAELYILLLAAHGLVAVYDQRLVYAAFDEQLTFATRLFGANSASNRAITQISVHPAIICALSATIALFYVIFGILFAIYWLIMRKMK